MISFHVLPYANLKVSCVMGVTLMLNFAIPPFFSEKQGYAQPRVCRVCYSIGLQGLPGTGEGTVSSGTEGMIHLISIGEKDD